MAGFVLRRQDGRFSLTVQGCCGASGARADYERAFLRQVLEEGGRVTGRFPDRLELTDRRGRRHTIDLRVAGLEPDSPQLAALTG